MSTAAKVGRSARRTGAAGPAPAAAPACGRLGWLRCRPASRPSCGPALRLCAGKRFAVGMCSLAGHQLAGEERFQLELHEDGSVW